MKRINKFSILTLKMEGFKRFKEPYTMEFDRLTYISGGNGQGKSTMADAIAYAFCGTPFWGEKSLDKLQNPECKEMSVEVQFVDEDGEIVGTNYVGSRSYDNWKYIIDSVMASID